MIIFGCKVDIGIIVSVVLGVLTILGSGVVSTVISHRLSKRKEENVYRRQKQEELYLSIKRFTTMMISMNIVWGEVMVGKLSMDQGLDIFCDRNDPEDKHVRPRIEMVISMYFPQLQKEYDTYSESLNSVNDIIHSFKECYRKNGPDLDYRKIESIYKAAMLNFENCSVKFLEDVKKVKI